MISSEFAVAMDCPGSAGGAWAENRDPKGGSGAFDEASGLAGGYNFSYHSSTLGGEGTVFGAIIGALIMQSLGNGMQMMNVNSNFQYMIKGFVLILAVWADISNKKKKA